MQSDTIVEETSPVYKRKRRISNGSTGDFQEDINSLRVAQHKSNALQEDAEKKKTVDTSGHQLRGGNSWKPELKSKSKSKSKSRHLTSSKAGAVMGSIGTVIGRRKLNSKIYLIQG